MNITIGINIVNSGTPKEGGEPPPSYTPALEFDEARNSMYLKAIGV